MRKHFCGLLRKLHYWLMENPFFWYRKELREADSFLCILASDLQAKKLNVRKTAARFHLRFLTTLLLEFWNRRKHQEKQLSANK